MKKKKKFMLSNIDLQEVSFVDKGAGEGVRVILMKRNDPLANLELNDRDDFLKTVTSHVLKEVDAQSFNEIVNDQELSRQFWSLMDVLHSSIISIMRDDDIDDKKAKIAESVTQFLAAVKNIKVTKGGTIMPKKYSVEELTKMTEELQAKQDELQKAHDALQETNTALAKENEELKKTAADSGEGEGEGDINKSELPEAVQKHLNTQDAQIKKQNDQIEKMQDENLTKVYLAKAESVTNTGAAEDIGLLLKAVATHDSELADQVETVLKACHERIDKGDLFKETGHTGGDDASAYEQLQTLAAEVAKASDGNLTKDQAFAKVLKDPENAGLRKQMREEK